MTQQLIKQVETKLQETRQLIYNHEQQLTEHKNILRTLTQQLQEIKLKVKQNTIKNINQNKQSPQDSKQIK